MRFIPNAVTSKVALTLLKTQKHSPTIMFGAGVVGVVATAVLTARATLRVEDILDEHNEIAAKIEKASGHPQYSQEDAVKDKALLFVKTGVKLTKLYGPPLAVAALSIGLLTGSHRILTKRNAALTAAYAAIEKGFRQYRDRVVEDLGEEKDLQYLHGVEKQKVVEVDADGKKKSVTREVATGLSPYGVLFHEGNPNWGPYPEHNYLFIRGVQRYANDQLGAKGFVLLNDIYDSLGFDRTQAGCVVGWLKNGDGDGFVDFGLFDDVNALQVHSYMAGLEGELHLDFNVDGIVYDKI